MLSGSKLWAAARRVAQLISLSSTIFRTNGCSSRLSQRSAALPVALLPEIKIWSVKFNTGCSSLTEIAGLLNWVSLPKSRPDRRVRPPGWEELRKTQRNGAFPAEAQLKVFVGQYRISLIKAQQFRVQALLVK